MFFVYSRAGNFASLFFYNFVYVPNFDYLCHAIFFNWSSKRYCTIYRQTFITYYYLGMILISKTSEI